METCFRSPQAATRNTFFFVPSRRLPAAARTAGRGGGGLRPPEPQECFITQIVLNLDFLRPLPAVFSKLAVATLISHRRVRQP